MANNANYVGINTTNYSDVKDKNLVGKQVPRTLKGNNSNYMGINTADYSDVKNKSLVGKQIPRNKKERISVSKNDIKKSLVSIGAVATIAGFGISNLISFVDSKQTVSKYLFDNRDVVSENTHRTNDNTGIWYDTDDMAFSVSESDSNKEALIYSVYSNMRYDRTKHMNSFMKSLSSYDAEYQQFEDFEDYIIKKGFVNEKGEPDQDSYKKYMDEYIYHIAKIDEAKPEIGGKVK